MKTNYILLFALMLMVSLKSSAQIFSGRVIGENQLPVEYATVALLSVPDSALVGGAVTDSKGVVDVEKDFFLGNGRTEFFYFLA